MTLSPAPFFDDVAGGAIAGVAHWATCDDGVRIRVGHWVPNSDVRGTILMFPGRTEYIEKYNDTAQIFAARGYAMLAIDWRGQGLADRLLDDGRIGHVEHFPDYQRDVTAAVKAAEALNLPKPWHLIGHSMGGCIGLRAVIEDLPVTSCAFTGPMWGIFMSRLVRPVGILAAYWGTALGMGNRLMPSTKTDGYVATQAFEGNALTNDAATYKMMQEQLAAHPELSLGGPSTRWMREALAEMNHLATLPSPDLPCLTFLGTEEKITDKKRIHDRMAVWPRGTLDIVQGAEHEILMESPHMRDHAIEQLDQHFTAAAASA